MPGQLLSGVPILISNDFDRTASFYGRLGFSEIDRHGGHYLIIRRDGVELHFRGQVDHDPAASLMRVYVRILNVNALDREWSALTLPKEGIPSYTPPVLQPWGMIELNIRDPDGTLLVFGASLEGET